MVLYKYYDNDILLALFKKLKKKRWSAKELIPCPSWPRSIFQEKEVSVDILDASEPNRPRH